jgi:putative ABC transport system ATP-binding protein
LICGACREHNVSLLMVTHSLEVAGRFGRVEKLQEFNRPEAAP